MKNTELIKALKEDAEWAHANDWETPITLGDHLDEAADALEAADKRVDELEDDGYSRNWAEIAAHSHEDIPYLLARLEKAEAEIKSIHESLNFADKSRSKCANYVELAVSNGLALGRIAVAIQHDYDAELPKGV